MLNKKHEILRDSVTTVINSHCVKTEIKVNTLSIKVNTLSVNVFLLWFRNYLPSLKCICSFHLDAIFCSCTIHIYSCQAICKF